MATSVTHAFVSAVADGADATLVRPSNWNAAHTFANQSANQVLAGPSSGAAAAPDFRALVAADLPAVADNDQYVLAGQVFGG